MEFLIVAIVTVIIVIIIKFIFDINLKKMKEIVQNDKLDKLAKKYPENKEICKWYLKHLDNESVEIEENTDKETCLYIAVTNKILIANTKQSYTRIQTVAHECLHSIQGKRILNFNFIYSNLYLIYFVVIVALAIFKVNPAIWMLLLSIFIILSMTYLLIRNYLENDAMIKARYLAKEYMEDVKISSTKEIEDIISEYDRINVFGIRGTNYQLFFNVCTKIIIFSLICFIRTVAF